MAKQARVLLNNSYILFNNNLLLLLLFSSMLSSVLCPQLGTGTLDLDTKSKTCTKIDYMISVSSNSNCLLPELSQIDPIQVNSTANVYNKTLKQYMFKHENSKQMKALTEMKQAVKTGCQQEWRLSGNCRIWPMVWFPQGLQDNCTTDIPFGCFNDKSGIKNGTCNSEKAFNKSDTIYFYNNVDINIKYQKLSENHEQGTSEIIILSVNITPTSQKNGSHENASPVAVSNGERSLGDLSFNVTYSITWNEMAKGADSSCNWLIIVGIVIGISIAILVWVVVKLIQRAIDKFIREKATAY
ncbi:unnamed protein product [Lymnaea stagnalis]|uniref:Uncharacterized protein n=1 Tax=Lymnaea stagnalis TaxID=6523 RepID=A0AAV2HA62_LYMST